MIGEHEKCSNDELNTFEYKASHSIDYCPQTPNAPGIDDPLNNGSNFKNTNNSADASVPVLAADDTTAI